MKRRQLQLEPLENRNLLTVLIGTREFPTIQDAIDNATAGNQILVGDGVYAESLDISRMGSAVGRATW
jgi:pectin methylesterase-like acyl-CoA thioesterase